MSWLYRHVAALLVSLWLVPVLGAFFVSSERKTAMACCRTKAHKGKDCCCHKDAGTPGAKIKSVPECGRCCSGGLSGRLKPASPATVGEPSRESTVLASEQVTTLPQPPAIRSAFLAHLYLHSPPFSR
jgi:hypothetical protein